MYVCMGLCVCGNMLVCAYVFVCLHMHVCVLGYQLLPGPGGTRSHDSRPEGAHHAATHLPSGAGPWGEVPNQVSALDWYVLCMWLEERLMFKNVLYYLNYRRVTSIPLN